MNRDLPQSVLNVVGQALYEIAQDRQAQVEGSRVACLRVEVRKQGCSSPAYFGVVARFGNGLSVYYDGPYASALAAKGRCGEAQLQEAQRFYEAHPDLVPVEQVSERFTVADELMA